MVSKSRRRTVARLRRRAGRERTGTALVEGPRVVLEALRAPGEVAWALVGETYAATEPGRRILEACRSRGVEAETAPDEAVRALCATEAPQPVLLGAKTPPMGTFEGAEGRYVLADGIQMPGNLGALARSAWAFGLDGVIVGPGTVDPWNAKAVRGSAGAVFRVPFLRAARAWLEDGAPGETLFHADPAGRPAEAALVEGAPPSWVLAVGNEGKGVSEAVRRRGSALAVPLQPGVESLNAAVAGSILLYALTRAAPGGEQGTGRDGDGAGAKAGAATGSARGESGGGDGPVT